MNSVPVDRASYRNRGSIFQRAISHYKCRRYVKNSGNNILIKASAQFWLTDGAELEIGDNSTIQDYVLVQLTKPKPKVTIGKHVVVGRGTIITCKNFIGIGDHVLIGSYVQIIDHNHSFASGRLIRDQPAQIGTVSIDDE